MGISESEKVVELEQEMLNPALRKTGVVVHLKKKLSALKYSESRGVDEPNMLLGVEAVP